MEFDLQEPAIVYAEARGWLVRRVKWVGRRGAQDTLFLKAGRHVWIEFKREDGNGVIAPAQTRAAKEFIAHGAESYIVDSWDVFLRILDGPL